MWWMSSSSLASISSHVQYISLYPVVVVDRISGTLLQNRPSYEIYTPKINISWTFIRLTTPHNRVHCWSFSFRQFLLLQTHTFVVWDGVWGLAYPHTFDVAYALSTTRKNTLALTHNSLAKPPVTSDNRFYHSIWHLPRATSLVENPHSYLGHELSSHTVPKANLHCITPRLEYYRGRVLQA